MLLQPPFQLLLRQAFLHRFLLSVPPRLRHRLLLHHLQELQALNDDRQKLVDNISKCKNAMNFSKLREQELRRNHDKLFNEAQRLDKKSAALDKERILIANDIRQATLEKEKFASSAELYDKEIETLKAEIRAERESAKTIEALIKKTDGFCIGAPTLGGHMPTPVSNALGVIVKESTREFPAGVFGDIDGLGSTKVYMWCQHGQLTKTTEGARACVCG